MGICEAITLEQIAHGFAGSPVSSTTAADVSSQEVSIPSMRIQKICHEDTKTRKTTIWLRGLVSSWLPRDGFGFERLLQRFDVRRPENAALGDDARNQLMRRHVEGRV